MLLGVFLGHGKRRGWGWMEGCEGKITTTYLVRMREAKRLNERERVGFGLPCSTSIFEGSVLAIAFIYSTILCLRSSAQPLTLVRVARWLQSWRTAHCKVRRKQESRRYCTRACRSGGGRGLTWLRSSPCQAMPSVCFVVYFA